MVYTLNVIYMHFHVLCARMRNLSVVCASCVHKCTYARVFFKYVYVMYVNVCINVCMGLCVCVRACVCEYCVSCKTMPDVQ